MDPPELAPRPQAQAPQKPQNLNPKPLAPECRNLIQKPWAFARAPSMNPTILGFQAQGFLIRFLHYYSTPYRSLIVTLRDPFKGTLK